MDQPKPSPLPKEELQRRVAERSAKVAAEKEAAAVREVKDAEMDKKMQEASKKFSRRNFAKGGSVSSASKRADGCATKGKTRGKFV
jgi:hypothetical protein